MPKQPRQPSGGNKSHESSEPRAHGSRIADLLPGCVFFILFYLYLWRYVDLRLIYHGAGSITNFPDFFRGWEFFK